MFWAVRAARGRMLTADDDRVRGGHPVAVISWPCWQSRFAGDPQIAGRTIKLNGMDYTILGVTPREFIGTEMVYTPEIYVPLAMVAQIEGGASWIDQRNSFNLFLIGRLKPGVSSAQARAGLDTIAADLGREYPKENGGMRIELSPPGLFGNLLRGTVQGFAAVLMGVAGLVLLIACVNLASLLLARAADRRRDTAIRLALGAGQGDLIRQLLTESLLLSVLGRRGRDFARGLADRFVRGLEAAGGCAGDSGDYDRLACVVVRGRGVHAHGHRVRTGAGARKRARKTGARAQERSRGGAPAQLSSA